MTAAGSTELSARDRSVVELVATFKQMTTGQIRASLFAELVSATPLDRTLKRLVERKHLNRLTRLVGGDHGGSGQFVYQLGRAGWKLLGKSGAYWAPRAVNLHTLAVADCYVGLLSSAVEVIQFVTEPACHKAVGSIRLTPDAYIELGYRDEQVKCSYFLEVDRSTEGIGQLQDKCSRYWQAFQLWQEPYYPTVVFVVPDKGRGLEVCRVVSGGPREARELFSIVNHEEMARRFPGRMANGEWSHPSVPSVADHGKSR